ncbi:MAG TPA: xanthine dehydrogenase family protein subunit M [Acidimicrobiales bacterium]|nr:xanthine dehydrogenase family protein subunit M [Acidimicrobiales bacterium]
MIPSSFDYRRASSLEEAITMLVEGGDDAKLLAGGHSLLPLMKLRLASPSVVVDIGPLRELSYVRDAGDHVAVGALTRHTDVHASDVARHEVPILAHVAGQIGDPQVRHRGTIGGSIAHGDPASDLPAVCLALRATFVLAGPSGQRLVPATEFYTGFLETALARDEVLTEIRLPKHGSGWSFQKFGLRAQDWAIVGVAAVRNGSAGVALVNMSDTPVLAAGVEAALAAGASPKEAATHASDGLEPPSDVRSSREYRRHLASVLVQRALEEAGA